MNVNRLAMNRQTLIDVKSSSTGRNKFKKFALLYRVKPTYAHKTNGHVF